MEFIKKNKDNIILGFILVLGFLVRLLSINIYPGGLNVDEASAGYDAYSILNYGIDRNGNFLPVFLVAWGSGQNALYTYISIPFIKIFGLNVFSIRLPMAIIGCISLIIMYKLLYKIWDKKVALMGTAFLVICPWHIMKSRWGLESNIFPDIILLAVLVLICGIKNNKKGYMYLSFVIFGISAYAYGTSYFFLPIFLIPLLIYLIKKREINIKQAFISIGIVFIVSLPIILCVLINKFDLPQINLPFCTIPRLQENRFEQLSSIFSGNIIENSLKNFIQSVTMLVIQNDNLPWNAMKNYGIIYLFSTIFTIIGIIKSFRNKDVYNWTINIWFIASFLLLFVCEPNINRCNIIILPIIYYTIIGIYEVIKNVKYAGRFLSIIYVIEFILFINSYINTDYSKYSTFQDNIQEVIEYAETLNVDNIYMKYSFKEPYIYILFYSKENPHNFIDTVEYFRKDQNGFDNVKSFGKYRFYLPDNIEENKNSAYIVPVDEEFNIDINKFKITNFKEFKVLEKIGED